MALHAHFRLHVPCHALKITNVCTLCSVQDVSFSPKSLRLPQDELLGLASDPQEGYLAEQIDPTVLQRQHEDRQVEILDRLST